MERKKLLLGLSFLLLCQMADHWLRKPLSWCGLKQMCLPSNGR